MLARSSQLCQLLRNSACCPHATPSLLLQHLPSTPSVFSALSDRLFSSSSKSSSSSPPDTPAQDAAASSPPHVHVHAHEASSSSSSLQPPQGVVPPPPPPPHAQHVPEGTTFSTAELITDANANVPLKSVQYASSFDDPFGVQRNWFTALYKQLNYITKTGQVKSMTGRQKQVFQQVRAHWFLYC